MPRSSRVSGLIFTPELFGVNPLTGRAMVTSLDIDVEPSVGILAKKIDKLSLDIRSFKEPLTRAVRKVMIPSIQLNFREQGRPERWQRLAPATVEKKGFKDILVDTGLLYKTMGQINVWHIDSDKALIADLPQKIWYGKVHQAGTGDVSASADIWFDPVLGKHVNVGDTTGINIPQRRFIMMQKEDEEAIEDVFDEWLGERIARAGLGTDIASKRGPS